MLVGIGGVNEILITGSESRNFTGRRVCSTATNANLVESRVANGGVGFMRWVSTEVEGLTDY